MENLTASIIQNRLKSAYQFKQRFNLHDNWRRYERFKAGDQWGEVTEATKTFPRPVFNLVKHITSYKKSSIMSENVNMVYNYVDSFPREGEMDYSELLSRYSETLWEEVQQDKLNGRALDFASTTGIGIWHYYWNSNFEGGNELRFTGKVEGEILDAMNVYFGNPQCLEVQQQPWIIILNRLPVKTIKEIALSNGIEQDKVDLIKPDNPDTNYSYDGGAEELQEEGKNTLLTMYFKEKGIVYFTRVCGEVVVQQPQSTDFKLYPMAIMNWDERKDNVYGVGEVEGMIPNQKALNLLVALQLMSVQLTGFPKMVYKKGAIDPRKISNKIGEMIEDKGQNPNIFSAQYLNAGQVSPLAGDLTQRFMDYTKDLSGAHRNVTGETRAENATAIMLLQKSAGVALDDIRRRFYQTLNEIGLIWLEFFKHRYNTTRMLAIMDANNTHQYIPFNGDDIKDTEFKLKINIGVSSAYAETFTTTALDKFLDKGLITFEQYLKYSPKNVIPFKDALLREIEKQKEQQTAEMEMELLSTLPPELREQYDMMDEQGRKTMLLALAKNKEDQLKVDMGQKTPEETMPNPTSPEPELSPDEIDQQEIAAMMNGEGMFRPSRPRI